MSIKVINKYFKDLENGNYVRLTDKHTAEEYFNIPLENRTRKVWWWPTKWYKLPDSLLYSSVDEFMGGDKEGQWSKLYKGLVKEFPIQARIREPGQYELKDLYWFIRKIGWKFEEYIYLPIRSIFKPYNRHLIKHIPRQYKSFGSIVEDILTEEFIKYCESDIYQPLSFQEDSYAGEELNNFWRQEVEERKKYYNYLKFERKEIIDQIDDIHSEIFELKTWDEKQKYYSKINEIENKKDKLDNDLFCYIVKNRWNLD